MSKKLGKSVRLMLLMLVGGALSVNTVGAADKQEYKLHKMYNYEYGLTGYFDMNGKVVIEPKYSTGFNFSEGVAAVCDETRHCEFIDEQGNVVIERKYYIAVDPDEMGFYEGLALVSLAYHRNSEKRVLPNEKAFIDHNGEIRFMAPYDAVGNFSEGLSVVAKYAGGGKYNYGAIDKEGNVAIPLQYRRMNAFKEGLALFQDSKGFYGYVDKTGKVVIPAKYRRAHDFSEGLAKVKINDKFGFIDKTGKVVIQPEYLESSTNGDFHEGLAVVDKFLRYDSKLNMGFVDTYVIDKKGKIVINVTKKFPQYDGVSDFHEGWAYIQIDNTIGNFIDKNGNLMFKKHRKRISEFDRGLALIQLSYDSKTRIAKYAHIDKTGKQVFVFDRQE
ncbi:WG repeat-containing protein [Cohnella terricola]|nr:WG repeat-containing protein [Cohnella terricola]